MVGIGRENQELVGVGANDFIPTFGFHEDVVIPKEKPITVCL
jgi:hypothetical protein